MSTQIKQNLFRFVTLRNPQLIDEKENHPGFIYHPELNETQKTSVFLLAIEGVAESERNAALKTEADTFPALKTRQESKEINQRLYRFSSWLMRNKKQLSYVSINENITNVTALSTSDEIVIWDNLIYQTLIKKSTKVREAMIQLLITNAFLKAFIAFSDGLAADVTFTDDQLKAFTRRACASVVITKQMLTAEATAHKPKKKLTASEVQLIDNQMDLAIAKENKQSLLALKKELKQAEVTYKRETQVAYEAAVAAHKVAVKTAYDSATPTMADVTDKYGNIYQVKRYIDLELPKLNFEKQVPTGITYIKTRISTQALEVYKTQKLDLCNSFVELYTAIEALVKTQTQTIIAKTPQKAKKISVRGATTTVGARALFEPYCFFASLKETIGGAKGISMFLGTGYAGAIAEEVSLTLYDDVYKIYYTGPVLQQAPNPNDHLRLFLPITDPLEFNGNYEFSGNLTLDNGVELQFDVDSVVPGTLRFEGCCKEVNPSENPEETSQTDKKVYGVTKLGIADFRRVEQEVCCYVPGEVSHIENVLAREFKERTTSSKISTEDIVERIDELERETLTDTSTTERNEIQSEVASVINQDQSQAYGASAGVSGGEGIKFFANASFDNATSSSTSNSNSQAQTYAQEVTERATERILSKTQTKRTSKILKEFLETNTHGFDNRKGDKHISGVYRWLDKIYKNKLINYGKRLMYEFAIPEPARFLKDALRKQVDNNQLESGVLLPEAPIHPTQFVLSDGNKVGYAADLTVANYQELAAQYNAEVVTPSKAVVEVSKAFKIEYGNSGDQDGNSVASSLEIPEGYEAIDFEMFGSIFSDGNASDNKAKIMVTVGNQQLGELYEDGHGAYNLIGSFTQPIKNELAVSASTYDMLSASLNVKSTCLQTQEAKQQWQNNTFNAIMNAYYERLQVYNEAVQGQEVIPIGAVETLKFNPAFNRSLEKKELKRVAMQLLAEPFGITLSRNDYDGSSLTNVKRDALFQNHAATVKFFEQAFDWDIMAYLLYPYMYADKNDWKDLFQQQDAADPIFQAFLQSGMARTVVPVTPGFEDAVNWFMETGELWNGEGMVVDQEDDLYISVSEELQTTEGEVEGTWETRLPTSLTVLQAGSIGLDAEGLPCNPDCHGDGTNPIGQTNTLIGEPSETTNA